MNSRLILSVSLAMMLSCGGPVAGEKASPPAEVAGDVFVQLRRTACFGSCPVYTVEVTTDGVVTFDGSWHVRTTGTHVGQIASAAVRALALEILSAGFLEVTQEDVDDCAEYWTDSPTAFLHVRIDGRENSIRHYHGCRGRRVYEVLDRLERRVDDVLQTSRWVGR